jgi:drug/metabolite transporter (DMT)-like permease
LTSLAIVLIVVSAFTHAGWNLLGKGRRPSAGLFLVANAAATALLIPAVVVLGPRLGAVPPSVWLLLAATGFFQALYYASLAGAYRAGDMSVAYPVARSVPVLLTTLVVTVTQGAGSFSLLYLAGCALVVAGMVLLPLRRASGSAPRASLVHRCTLLAALAGLGTTAYSTIDSSALAVLRGSGAFTTTGAALFYLAGEALFSTLWTAAYTLVVPGERRDLARVALESWRQAVLMGIGIHVAYGLVLVAMSFARNVGYVVAFRQLGVPVGAVLAILVYHEPAPPLRIAGIAVTGAGLLLIALG